MINNISIIKRLYKDYTLKHLKKIIIAIIGDKSMLLAHLQLLTYWIQLLKKFL